jgi:hypothetical protein
MTLLAAQFQFRVVGGLSFWIMVLDAWRKALDFAECTEECLKSEANPFFSPLFWSPLLMILFMDAIKRQSKLFRVAMLVAYFVYVIVQYIMYGYIRPSTTIVRQDTTNSTVSGKAAAAMGTFEGQISGSLYSIALLMLACLKAAMRDKTNGDAISFPMKLATVMKNTVPLILRKGKMMTQLDEDSQCVVLVPKVTSRARAPCCWAQSGA